MKKNILFFPITFIYLLLFIFSPECYCQSLSAEQIYKKVSDAVVVVQAYNDDNELIVQGSGVVLNEMGYVVTNYHVLAGNNSLKILHRKDIVPYVDIIGINVEKDILILKIEAKKFPAIKIGDSKFLHIGQRVYAIGSPMGFENSISEGIISGLRSVDELKRNFIQMTASISPGSSGGAVVNDKGELIGISTLTSKEGQNLNFAIPINDILNVEIASYNKDKAYKDFDYFKKGYDAREKGDYNEAIKCYSLYIEKHPNDAKAYNNRGIAKHYLADYEGEIQDYNKAIELNPNESINYSNRGVAEESLEDYKAAIQDDNKAIELDSNFANAYYNRGIAKEKLSDYQGAIQDYNKVIELNPNDAEVYYNRGITNDKLQDYQSEIKDYDQAIVLNPDYADAYYNRGFAKYLLKNYDEALVDAGIANSLGNIRAYHFMEEICAKKFFESGSSKYKLKDYIGAIQDYNKVIELNPNYINAYSCRGIAKYFLEDYRGAIEDLNKAILLNPNYAYGYSCRGIAKYKLGDINGACLDWSKAGELGITEAYDFIKNHCR